VKKHVPVAAINVALGNASCGLATIDPIRLAPAGGADLLCCHADARVTAALAVGCRYRWVNVGCVHLQIGGYDVA
jgi:hypothetical protein